MSAPEQDTGPPPQDDPFAFLKQPSTDDGRTKSRGLGVFFLLLGGALVAWAENGGWMPRKLFFALVCLGPAVAWMGIGLIAFPLTGAQFKKAFEQDEGFGSLWRELPLVWKVWFVLTFAIMAAGFVYAITVAG